MENLLHKISEQLDVVIELLTQMRDKDGESSRDRGIPLPITNPPKTSTPYYPQPFPQYEPYTEKRCGVCGIQLEGVMGYSCTRMDCPTGLGPVTSQT